MQLCTIRLVTVAVIVATTAFIVVLLTTLIKMPLSRWLSNIFLLKLFTNFRAKMLHACSRCGECHDAYMTLCMRVACHCGNCVEISLSASLVAV